MFSVFKNKDSTVQTPAATKRLKAGLKLTTPVYCLACSKMNRTLLLLIFSGCIAAKATAADTLQRPYNPLAKPQQQLAAAITQAKKEGKRILVQVGGNWCVQCYRIQALMNNDSSIRRTLLRNYVPVHIAYNKQQPDYLLLRRWGSPQQYGFPSFVVLDSNGKYLHTQPGTALQKGNGYNPQKVLAFLQACAAGTTQPF